MTSSGPSIRAVCRIINQNSCGSGSICGLETDGRAYILTNAHVAGTRLGRIVNVDVESKGDRIRAEVIRAAYSSNTWTDWALLLTSEPYTKVKPVKLSKKRPTGSHYTKGFPRCRAHGGTDIRTVRMDTNSGLWLWQPDAIGGQSGSGVWDDETGLQHGLLTWSVGTDGAGQMTSHIYRQNRLGTVDGAPRLPGMVERLPDDFDFDGINRDGCDEPGELIEGFSGQVGIQDYPIWAEDDPIVDPPTGDNVSKLLAEYHREAAQLHEKWNAIFEGVNPPGAGGLADNDSDDGMFGMG